MARRPPTPTLFPYTTLFRSRAAAATDGEARLAARRAGGRAARRVDRARDAADGPAPARARRAGAGRGRVPRADRKSTRLNSSHMSISYAVFCLKKKNTHLTN